MLVEIKNTDASASVFVNPANPLLVVVIPSPLAGDPTCQIATGGPILIKTSEAEARKLLLAVNAQYHS